MNLVHVFFGSLPVGTGFWHKNGWHIKTDEEEAYCVLGKRWIFEIHYGCVITQELGAALRLQQEDYIDDGPVPDDDAYIEKLFGKPLASV